MDPLTQGVLGAALPQSTLKNSSLLTIAGVLGFLAGMAADLDAFITSATDPLIYLQFHRHFTHSLIFIPFGGLICALALHWLGAQSFGPKRWGLGFKQTYLFCTLGYATHALLDACTSYGTMLFWPFSHERVSWSYVSVVDPLVTVPMLILVALAVIKKRIGYARAALAWMFFYLFLGFTQERTAVAMAKSLAESRGLAPARIEAKPTFANILIWKTITEADGRFYIDGVRTGFSPRVFEGTSLPKLDIARDYPWLDPNAQQAKDIERFTWFSQGFVTQDPLRPNRVIDVRYSFLPQETASLWSIELSPDAAATAHVRYLTHRDNPRESAIKLWAMLLH
jgi:inner membrane protein